MKGDLSILRLCNASSPVSLEAVNSVLIYRHMQHRETKTKSFKCFLLCLYVEYDWMDREGSFKLNNIKSSLQSTIVEDHHVKVLIYKCTAIELIDPCDRAFHFTECFWSQDDEEKDSKANITEKKTKDELSGFYHT
uniref:Odorant binding protein 2 n=1 Tax=Sirex noctilio TaxID=36765 RepID=A0A857N4Y3_9HYME|nr:odorant binding protein 2 [Sirex noctilio]